MVLPITLRSKRSEDRGPQKALGYTQGVYRMHEVWIYTTQLPTYSLIYKGCQMDSFELPASTYSATRAQKPSKQQYVITVWRTVTYLRVQRTRILLSRKPRTMSKVNLHRGW